MITEKTKSGIKTKTGNSEISEGKNTPPKTLRVCFLVETFYPPYVGGLEIHSYHIAERLNNHNVEMFVITRKFGHDSKSFEQVGNVPIIRITPEGIIKGQGWKALFPVVLIILKTLFLLIKYSGQYDILLVSSLKVLSIPAIIMKYLFGKKCIIMVNSPSELQEDIISDESLKRMKMSRSSIMVKLVRAVRNPLIKKTDCFVAISHEIKQQFLDIGVELNKIRVIPNGIDINKFSPVSQAEKMELRKKLYLPEDKIIFCYTGRIAEAKGIMLLAEVWKNILKEFNNIYLLYVGAGRDSFDNCEDELRKFIEDNNLGDKVTCTGRVPEMNVYLQASDVFVFPSYYEGFGLSILEALACGLPSVLTKVGSAAEIVNNYENGIVVTPRSRDELYDAIKWILKNKDLWEVLGRNARKSVEKYSTEAEINNFIGMFTDINRQKN
jgi:glycosyltransferase involved in cell wall biosynthesis